MHAGDAQPDAPAIGRRPAERSRRSRPRIDVKSTLKYRIIYHRMNTVNFSQPKIAHCEFVGWAYMLRLYNMSGQVGKEAPCRTAYPHCLFLERAGSRLPMAASRLSPNGWRSTWPPRLAGRRLLPARGREGARTRVASRRLERHRTDHRRGRPARSGRDARLRRDLRPRCRGARRRLPRARLQRRGVPALSAGPRRPDPDQHGRDRVAPSEMVAGPSGRSSTRASGSPRGPRSGWSPTIRPSPTTSPGAARAAPSRRSPTAATLRPRGLGPPPLGLEPDRYLVSIARIEPDNNILTLVEAFSRRPRGLRLVVLGTLNVGNPYHRAVEAAASAEVLFPGAIYEAEPVQALRVHARAYLHGHTVGGTNPSLVEALWAGNAVIAHDNPFNRGTAGDGQFYFSDAETAAPPRSSGCSPTTAAVAAARARGAAARRTLPLGRRPGRLRGRGPAGRRLSRRCRRAQATPPPSASGRPGMVMRRAGGRCWPGSLAAAGAAACSRLAPRPQPLPLRRGIALWPWFSLTTEFPAPRTDYAWPPFQADRPVPTAADLRRLADLGFDFVAAAARSRPLRGLHGRPAQRTPRQPVGRDRRGAGGRAARPGQRPGERRHPPLHAGRVLRLRSGAAVPRLPRPRRRARAPAAPGRARTAWRWSRSTSRRRPAAPLAWNRVQESLLTAARAAAPALTLVATGACGSLVAGLTALDPAPLARFAPLLYTFHFYEPYLFSHQGATWLTEEPFYRWLNAVPWPGTARTASGDARGGPGPHGGRPDGPAG